MTLRKRLCMFLCGFLGCTCLCFLVKPVFAQRVGQVDSFGSDVVKLYKSIQTGGAMFGGLSVKTTRINGIEGTMFGVRATWRVLGPLHVGFAGYRLMNQDYNTRFLFEGHQTRLKTAYGGAEVIYSYKYDRSVHLSFYSLFGLGKVRYKVEDGYGGDLGRDYFLVIEPGVNLEMKLANRLRVSVGSSYRIAKGVNYYNLDDSDMSGLASSVSFRFGMF